MGPGRLWNACFGKRVRSGVESCLVERVGLGGCGMLALVRVRSGRPMVNRGNIPVDRVRCERLALDTGK